MKNNMLLIVLACSPYSLAEPKAFEALLRRVSREPRTLAAELRALSRDSVISHMDASSSSKAAAVGAKNASLPVVLAHGMGDSCFNPGFKSVTAAVGKRLGVYATCKPTGDSQVEDTINGFFLNVRLQQFSDSRLVSPPCAECRTLESHCYQMDASVDVFAKHIQSDPQLAGGFNAIGLSQGNNLIRGYIQKYNDPPVNAFISICGINAGVAAFPQCSPSTPGFGAVCTALTEVLGTLADTKLVQDHLFQANYFRDPTKLGTREYKANSQLAQWNGEGDHSNSSASRHNWLRTQKFVWVRGTKDTVVWPNEGEQWGALNDDYPRNKTVVPMQQTRWYKEDSFGLRTADEQGRNAFEEFDGEHIRFTIDELYGWMDKYFTA